MLAPGAGYLESGLPQLGRGKPYRNAIAMLSGEKVAKL
jgi:hypothetical protein